MDGGGRIAALEILIVNSAVSNLIRENKTFQIGSMIQTGGKQGMMTLDQYLASLVKNNQIRYEDAAAKAKNLGELDALLERENPPRQSVSTSGGRR